MFIIAHRGNSRHAPENTLPAFEAALAVGADMVELDYQHSADGIPVVFHDEYLDRTTDCDGRVALADKTLAELRQLDAGSWFDARFVATKISTLEEAVDVIQPHATTVIEHKSGDAETCVELLRRKQVSSHVVVMSFDWKFIAACRRLAAELTLTALGDDPLDQRRIETMRDLGVQIVGWKQELIGKPEIDSIHAQGMQAWVFTVNDAERARELRDCGLDGLITDLPAEMRVAVCSNGS